MVLNQLFCENTFIEGIKILPQSYRLVINKDQMKIIRYQAYTSSVDYSAELLSFANIWCSRFACLMQKDDLEIRADLTGGKDSRTLFALLKKTNDVLSGVKQLPVICTQATENNKIDFEIAQKITSAYGFPHNTQSKLKKRNK